MKLAAKKSASHVAELQRQIDDEREAIRLLKAEWSMLNQPERLQRLVERYNSYLQLQPLDVKQIVSPEELPARPVMLEPVGRCRADGRLCRHLQRDPVRAAP